MRTDVNQHYQLHDLKVVFEDLELKASSETDRFPRPIHPLGPHQILEAAIDCGRPRNSARRSDLADDPEAVDNLQIEGIKHTWMFERTHGRLPLSSSCRYSSTPTKRVKIVGVRCKFAGLRPRKRTIGVGRSGEPPLGRLVRGRTEFGLDQNDLSLELLLTGVCGLVGEVTCRATQSNAA